jgi:hypothetical protein
MAAIEFVSPPAQPHATVYNASNPKTSKARRQPFWGPLGRARHPQSHTLLRVLRELVPIIQTTGRRATRAHSPQRGPPLTTRSF